METARGAPIGPDAGSVNQDAFQAIGKGLEMKIGTRHGSKASRRIGLHGSLLALAFAMSTPLGVPAGAASPSDGEPDARRFRFDYAATIPSLAAGQRVELWLPLPRESVHQDVGKIDVEAPEGWQILTEERYGNRLLRVAGSSEDLAGKTVHVRFEATRRAVAGDYEPATVEDLALSLGPDSLVPIDGIIAERAHRVAAESDGGPATARELYDDVVSHLTYDKSGEGWGRGDAIYACNVEKGNCTDYHSLFMGMCRALGIPARFTIGFPLPAGEASGTIGGYHCWAEYCVDGRGWIPVDASEASKHPERTNALFGGLDPDRIEFTRGRDLRLPGHPDLEPLNFLIYPYLLVDGRPASGVEKSFSFADVDGVTGS